MDRRRFLGGLGTAAAALALPACSSADGGATAPSSTQAAAATTWQVTHRYGTTTVSGPPQRVVTLGQTDHDAAIALGVVPVAVGGFLGSSYTPFRPWNSAGLTTPPPPVLDMQEIAYEKVAALAPDLILAVMSGVTKEDYARLSRIAPTVAQPVDAEDWAVPYRAAHRAHRSGAREARPGGDARRRARRGLRRCARGEPAAGRPHRDLRRGLRRPVRRPRRVGPPHPVPRRRRHDAGRDADRARRQGLQRPAER